MRPVGARSAIRKDANIFHSESCNNQDLYWQIRAETGILGWATIRKYLDEAGTTMPNLPAVANDTAGETQENESYEDDIAALLAFAHIHVDVCYGFNGMFGYVKYTTSYCADGHRRIIWDFHVTSESASVFHVEVDEDGCSFMMTKRINPHLLDIMGRSNLELSQRHPDTHTILARDK